MFQEVSAHANADRKIDLSFLQHTSKRYLYIWMSPLRYIADASIGIHHGWSI
jgi:hypothetical protein